MRILRELILVSAVAILISITTGEFAFAQLGGGEEAGESTDIEPKYSGGPDNVMGSILNGADGGKEVLFFGGSRVTINDFEAGETLDVRNVFRLYRVHTLPLGEIGPAWWVSVYGSNSCSDRLILS